MIRNLNEQGKSDITFSVHHYVEDDAVSLLHETYLASSLGFTAMLAAAIGS